MARTVLPKLTAPEKEEEVLLTAPSLNVLIFQSLEEINGLYYLPLQVNDSF
jgi:hypothetical protein